MDIFTSDPTDGAMLSAINSEVKADMPKMTPFRFPVPALVRPDVMNLIMYHMPTPDGPSMQMALYKICGTQNSLGMGLPSFTALMADLVLNGTSPQMVDRVKKG